MRSCFVIISVDLAGRTFNYRNPNGSNGKIFFDGPSNFVNESIIAKITIQGHN